MSLAAAALATAFAAPAQVVEVTMGFDSPIIGVGQSTTLRVWAQVAPGQRASADRIFSWYVDLLNSGAAFAQANYNQLVKAAADNDPRTSSSGVTEGAHRRGVYDTFLNLPGAGVSQPVELFSVPVTGLIPGRAVFRVQAGTGVPNLAADFIVAPKDGGDPWLGGNYAGATATLQVQAGGGNTCSVTLSATHERLAGGQHRVTLTFTPCAGRTHIVEFRDSLTTGQWTALPGAPHNTGSVTDTAAAGRRFYRVRLEGGGATPPCVVQLRAVHERLAGGQHRVTLTFTPCAGRTHTVEFRDSLTTGQWTALPGAPHNTGSVTDTAAAGRRFYRVRVE